MSKVIVNKEKIEEILTRGVEEIIDYENLKKRLLKGERLRIKYGIDPTGEKLHLGHAAVLWKLKDFQDLGHQIVLIIGDYTAQIGDPSDRLEKRPFLSLEQVKENMKTYKKQIGLILDISKVEWHRNSEWLAKLTPIQIDKLAELFTVQQLLARRNFRQRLERKEEISLRELHYPLYQGYDSVKVRADLEIGGSDQLFNLLAGRKIQEAFGQKPQDILTLKMLEGLDGEKMSKTRGNIVNFIDPPEEIYGKIMSLHDDLIIKYFELCTRLPLKEISNLKSELKKGKNPRDIKAKLAFEIVKLYYGQEKAKKAEEEFNRVFKEKKLPSKIISFKVKAQEYDPLELLVNLKLAKSKSEARRLIEQRGVKIDGKTIENWREKIKIFKETIIRVGPRRFVKLDV
jgi:tyrosyl-tRNA synthetase